MSDSSASGLSRRTHMVKRHLPRIFFGIDETFVVPCQNVLIPQLQNYVRSEHKAILFDEISSSCIEKNKQVFQANNDVALLGQTPSGDYVYHKYLYGTAMICCTNEWLEGIRRGSAAEEWLLTNSIVYDCVENMYLPAKSLVR